MDPDDPWCPTCPDCGYGHITPMGFAFPYREHVDIIFKCLRCEHVNTLYITGDGSCTVIGWSGDEGFRKKQAQARQHVKTMTNLMAEVRGRKT